MAAVLGRDEYATASAAVQAHFHAVRAEDAFRQSNFALAEKEGRVASAKFLEAAQQVRDKRTVDALVLLAENYEYRAKVARARNPAPVEDDEGGGSADKALDAVEDGADASLQPTEVADAAGQERAAEPDESGGNAPDRPDTSAATEAQLNMAAVEMEELWRRLHEIGLSSGGSSDKQNNLLMSSRHLSSSLGDSFCLLPAKTRTTYGVQATAIDGGSTLRAAVASRMRNHRVRLMEQQLGGRVVMERHHHHHPALNNTSEAPSNAYRSKQDQELSSHERQPHQHSESTNREDIESLEETVTHQKMEIVRLLNTVKTLSTENTKLVKKCETLTNIQAENQEIREAMDRFKKTYSQKLVMIKRALEEWRRQQGNAGPQPEPSSTPSTPTGGRDAAAMARQLQLQEQQIQKLQDAMRTRDEQLAKYEKWYQTLKAGAKAKQRSQMQHQHHDGAGNGGTTPTSSFTSAQSSGGGVAYNSFTSSNSFHDSSTATGDSSTFGYGSSGSSRPPAHPNRRAL